MYLKKILYNLHYGNSFVNQPSLGVNATFEVCNLAKWSVGRKNQESKSVEQTNAKITTPVNFEAESVKPKMWK